jgi:hypothetical protein
LHNCERFGQLQNVCAAETVDSSHRPDGRLTFAHCLQGGGVYVSSGTSVTITSSSIYENTARFVRDHVQKFPSPSRETHGRLTFCSLFAGWRCLCPGWHSGHLIVHHKWERSLQCACSCSIFPIAPMGDSRVLVVYRAAVSMWRVAR